MCITLQNTMKKGQGEGEWHKQPQLSNLNLQAFRRMYEKGSTVMVFVSIIWFFLFGKFYLIGSSN